MANVNNTSSYMDEDKSKLLKSPIIPIEMLLKFQHILSKQVSSKDSTRKCKSTTFKKNLTKWMNRTSKQKYQVITLKTKTIFSFVKVIILLLLLYFLNNIILYIIHNKLIYYVA